MHKTLFGIAAIIFALAFALNGLPHAGAQPTGPSVTGGENPWLSWTGTVGPEASSTVYTVPADRVFIVTGACFGMPSSPLLVDLLEGSTPKLLGYSRAATCDGSVGAGGLVGAGAAHIKFSSGSTVILENNDTNQTATYYMEGYLAAP
jgi:hypothetical protein